MNENKQIMRKTLSITYNPVEEELLNMRQEDRELYLFMRGGFAAK